MHFETAWVYKNARGIRVLILRDFRKWAQPFLLVCYCSVCCFNVRKEITLQLVLSCSWLYRCVTCLVLYTSRQRESVYVAVFFIAATSLSIFFIRMFFQPSVWVPIFKWENGAFSLSCSRMRKIHVNLGLFINRKSLIHKNRADKKGVQVKKAWFRDRNLKSIITPETWLWNTIKRAKKPLFEIVPFIWNLTSKH